MSWDPTWETIYQTRGYNRYPSEEVIGFVLRHFSKVPDRKQVKILEIGCGQGANLWFLAREGFDTYGIDASETAIAKAEQYLQTDRQTDRQTDDVLKANLQIGDFMMLNHFYPASQFDAVIDMGSLQHNPITAIQIVLDQVLTVLKPGGRVFSRMLQTGISEQQLQGWGFVQTCTLEEVQQLFSRFADLKVEESLRSVDNRRHWAKRWVIEAMKSERA